MKLDAIDAEESAARVPIEDTLDPYGDHPEAVRQVREQELVARPEGMSGLLEGPEGVIPGG